MIKLKTYIVTSLIFLISLLTACDSTVSENSGNESTKKIETTEVLSDSDIDNIFIPATINSIKDNDIVEVIINDEIVPIVLVGIATPNSLSVDDSPQFFGTEANSFIKEKLNQKTVYLQNSLGDELIDIDEFGNHLYYLWLKQPDSIHPSEDDVKNNMLNAQLISNGYAETIDFPANAKYRDLFLSLQSIPQSNRWGVWGIQNTVIVPQETIQPEQPQQQQQNKQYEPVTPIQQPQQHQMTNPNTSHNSGGDIRHHNRMGH